VRQARRKEKGGERGREEGKKMQGPEDKA